MRVLLTLSVCALVLAVVTRFYAIIWCVPIRTWDDAEYRVGASGMQSQSVADILRAMLLPNPRLRVGPPGRTQGYQYWLSLGSRWASNPNREKGLQLVNVAFLCVQLGCVYGLAGWALGQWTLAFAAGTLYLLSPIVFGINRWLLSENFLMAGLWLTIASSVWLLPEEGAADRLRPGARRGTARTMMVALGAGFGVGISTPIREYAVPLVATLAIASLIGLLVHRRWLMAVVFGSVGGAYVACAVSAAMPPLVVGIRFTMHMAEYFHPLPQWILHVTMESWGPFLTITLCAGVAALLVLAASRLFRQFWARGVRRPSGLAVLWATIGLLLGASCGGLVLSFQRDGRASISMLILAMAFVLVGLRVLHVDARKIERALSAWLSIGLVVSCLFQAYHLFVRFDGGRTFAVDPYAMPYYNYPLGIRPLTSPNDMHTRK